MKKQKTVKTSFNLKDILKTKWFISVIVLLLVMGVIVWGLNNRNKELILLKANLKIELNSNIKIKDLIERVNRKIAVLNNEEVIDTSAIGVKELSIKYLNQDNKENSYVFSVEVLDQTKPVINGVQDIVLIIGNKTDLLDGITVTDNSKEDLEVKVEGEYDFDEIGVYNLKYVTADSSNNITEMAFTLSVEPYKVKHEGVYYWDDRNNDISIVFSDENEVTTKTCRKWGENACSSEKGTYEIKGNKITITYTHYKEGYEDPKWLELNKKNTQTLTIKSIDVLEQSTYVYNHMDI